MISIIILAVILFAFLGVGGTGRSRSSRGSSRGGMRMSEGHEIRRRGSIGNGGEHSPANRGGIMRRENRGFSRNAKSGSSRSGGKSSGSGGFGGGGSRGGGAGRR